MNFTAHNILLKNGKTTLGNGPLLADTQECKAIIRTLNQIFRPDIRHATRVVDLGCLEGGYAIEIAKAGYQVVGIEARKDSVDNCNFVKEQLGLTNVSFFVDDVKNLAQYGHFDAVFCHGLLYHLDKPATFLKLVESVCKKVLILGTHYSQPSDYFLYDFLPFLTPYRVMLAKRLPFLNRKKKNYGLSSLTNYDNKRGRWFKEYSTKASREKIEKSKWAAYSNDRSFWLCKQDLLQAMKEAGFPVIYQQFDNLESMYDDYIDRHDSGLFVGIK